MNFKPRYFIPHESHKIQELAYEEILAPSGTDRFYNVRECEYCGAQEANGNAHLADDELEKECIK